MAQKLFPERVLLTFPVEFEEIFWVCLMIFVYQQSVVDSYLTFEEMIFWQTFQVFACWQVVIDLGPLKKIVKIIKSRIEHCDLTRKKNMYLWRNSRFQGPWFTGICHITINLDIRIFTQIFFNFRIAT